MQHSNPAVGLMLLLFKYSKQFQTQIALVMQTITGA